MADNATDASAAPVRLRIIDGGHFRLDGGTMFGVVPRAIWQTMIPPDADNCIRMACWCVLVERGRRRILIETGMGCDYDEKERAIYGLTDCWIAPALETVGVAPSSIDTVVLTHAHFDHAAGLTKCTEMSTHEIVFPNAGVIVQAGEWADALSNYSTTKSSYRPDALRAIEASGRLQTVEGTVDLGDGITVRVTPGHTRHHQSVMIRGGSRTACFTGELLPTIHHARPSYQMAYDLDPMETMRQKAALMAEAMVGDWLLLLDHDPDHPAVTVTRDDRGRFALAASPDTASLLGDGLVI